jgi:hypothetical protein
MSGLLKNPPIREDGLTADQLANYARVIKEMGIAGE